MLRTTASVLGLALLGTPAWADAKMVQSPLLMRRAGPSCQPGNLQGDAAAGYGYALGSCAGVYHGEDDAVPDRRRPLRGGRRP